jgi:hypothetical protein
MASRDTCHGTCTAQHGDSRRPDRGRSREEGKKRKLNLGAKELCSLTACFFLAQQIAAKAAALAQTDHRLLTPTSQSCHADPTPALLLSTPAPRTPSFGTWGSWRGGREKTQPSRNRLPWLKWRFPLWRSHSSQARRLLALPREPAAATGVRFGRGARRLVQAKCCPARGGDGASRPRTKI